MPRLQFRNPPVHEVILSLHFHRDADDQELDAIPPRAGRHFSPPERLQRAEMEVNIDAAERQVVGLTMAFEGWVFKNPNLTRVLQAGRSRLSLHAVRSTKWPAGPYEGWEAIYAWAQEMLLLLSVPYQDMKVKRAGVRYLNRVAVPADSDPTQWFRIGLQAPAFLQDPFSFDLRQTWALVQGHEDLSATIGLAKIAIEEPAVAAGKQGVLLDIEVFNLRDAKAPSFEQLPKWLAEAHEVENVIFAASITDALGDTFGRI